MPDLIAVLFKLRSFTRFRLEHPGVEPASVLPCGAQQLRTAVHSLEVPLDFVFPGDRDPAEQPDGVGGDRAERFTGRDQQAVRPVTIVRTRGRVCR